MKTLKDFAAEHGIRAIVRRHFDYENPIASVTTAGGGFTGLQGALTYTRALDPAKLGLSAKGVQDAIRQGCRLAEMEISPKRIICGVDQRNYDGARFTAAGIKEVTGGDVPYYTSPAVTYPHYSDPVQVARAIEDFGDYAIHMYLAGKTAPVLCDLWTEPASVFEARIVSAVKATYGAEDKPVLFDLNFEQMVLLYFLHVKKITRHEIPCQDSWLPTKGGGIVYGRSEVIVEFTPDLEIVAESI